MEDPYFIVKNDIEKALENLSQLFESFKALSNEDKISPEKNQQLIEVRGDIKTALRDVQYDIEDIEETVRIVEANPKKFKIGVNEIQSRKDFISHCKNKLTNVENSIRTSKPPSSSNRSGGKENQMTKSGKTKSGVTAKYSKLESYQDEENEKFMGKTFQEQEQLLKYQDEQVEKVSTSIGVLKSMSRQIGEELDHQNVALEDLHHEMDSTAAKMDNVMKKLAKVTRLSDDKRQWTAIVVLLLTILVLVLLLVLL